MKIELPFGILRCLNVFIWQKKKKVGSRYMKHSDCFNFDILFLSKLKIHIM